MDAHKKIETGFPAPAKGDSAARGEEGQTLPEYALIIALISVALITALTFLQGHISSLFSQVGNAL